MRIGAMNHPARDPVKEVRWIGEHGFDFVDFTFEGPAADPDVVDIAVVRAELDRHELEVIAHTAWYIPIGSPLPSVRRAALEEFRRALGPARRLGARLMNAHYRPPPGFFRRQQVVAWHVETLAPLCDEAGEIGITMMLEHAPHAGSDQLETFLEILDAVPALGFHLDTGHAKLEKGEDRFDEYLEKLGGRLAHVHLSENDGTGDQHLPLGAAPRSRTVWPELVRKLKSSGYDGTITLEVFADFKEYLLASRDLLRRWWQEA